jgi:hypothetical protein
LSENQKIQVDANSREFRRGVEAGLDSEVTKFWQAGYELGHELNGERPGNGQRNHPERARHSTLSQIPEVKGEAQD